MDRHLLPDEIDQLLDGEAGFGTAPLKAHARHCADCQAELESARMIVRQLEHLPVLSPSGQFSERVLAHVPVFVPWRVALLDSIRGLAPRTGPGRVAATLALASTVVMLAVASLWLVSQLDTVVFALNLGVDRVREGVFGVVASAFGGVVSQSVLDALRSSGLFGITVLALVMIALTAGAARAVRALASGSRAR